MSHLILELTMVHCRTVTWDILFWVLGILNSVTLPVKKNAFRRK